MIQPSPSWREDCHDIVLASCARQQVEQPAVTSCTLTGDWLLRRGSCPSQLSHYLEGTRGITVSDFLTIMPLADYAS